jgi:hypothetical protein
VFRPSQALIRAVTANVRPDYDIILLLALLAIAGLALAWRRLCAALEREIQRIETAAEHRTPLVRFRSRSWCRSRRSCAS